MTTPIADFLDNYSSGSTIRAHMPGHKGKYGYDLDITEIKGADSLFEADGIIAESEKNCSEIFGSYKTVYSAGGSTLCIQTMLAMCLADSPKRIAAARNCHRSLIHACAFLDAEIEWIYPEYSDSIVSGRITAQAVEKAILRSQPTCVYITSPDYLGRITELDEISAVCRKYNTLLLVDNAHGAYLRFICGSNGKPLHPIYHGADICCDSAHKTLPVLTGGAYLHINNKALEKYDGFCKDTMSMFGSSSPSYLILRSLDLCNRYLTENCGYFSQMKKASEDIKESLSAAWHIEETECGKLTINTIPSGLYGYQLAERLRQNSVECEYADNTHAVLMLTGLETDEIYKIAEILKTVKQPKLRIDVPEVKGFAPLPSGMSIRQAAFSPSEMIPVDEAEGRICARAVSCCPPGIAAVVNGELFSRESINILKNYSIFQVSVVK